VRGCGKNPDGDNCKQFFHFMFWASQKC